MGRKLTGERVKAKHWRAAGVAVFPAEVCRLVDRGAHPDPKLHPVSIASWVDKIVVVLAKHHVNGPIGQGMAVNGGLELFNEAVKGVALGQQGVSAGMTLWQHMYISNHFCSQVELLQMPRL